MKDLFNNIKCQRAMAPVAATTDNTAYVSAILDMAGAEEGVFVGLLGSVADADTTLTVLVEDGDNSALSDAAAVDDAYLHGVEAMGLTFASDNTVFKIGYTGQKRYVRVTITPANNTGNLFLCGAWITAGLKKQPQSTQVV